MREKLLKQWRWMESKSQSLLLGVLLLLFPLLAGLQYRWLGQLSEREEKQLRANLHAAATRFGQDFDQEITAAYAAFIPTFSPAALSPSQQTATAWEQWQATAANPQLIQTVYQISLDSARQLRLTRFNAETRQFETYDWPLEWQELRQRLQTQLNQFTERFRRLPDRESSPPPPPPAMGQSPLLYAQNHLLLIPQPTQVRQRRDLDEPAAFSFSVTLLQLNAEYLAASLLPKLALRHFGETSNNRYELAIGGGLPPRQLYPAFSSSQVSAANADVSVDFFRLRASELRERMRQRMQARPPAEFKFPPPLPGNPPQLLSASPVLPLMGPLMGSLAASDQAAGQWQLHVRHPSGSLATAVAQARRRNLWLSSGILLLLGGSVVLLVRSARRARRLAQQQMDFVAGISHELRTPITVIESAAYNLSKGVTRSPEQMQQYGQIIRKQTRQLHEMIEQVLEFAGIQRGRQPYELQPVSLRALLDEFVQANQSALTERGFQLHLDLPEQLPTIQADASALRRALQNLLNNAEKYSGDSRWIGLRAQTEAMQVMLSITDRGVGIAPADVPHLFEPFYRGSEARAAQIHGSGLGLSIVQNIVEAHGGTLRVQSEPGVGSTFTMCLPLHAAPHASEAPRRAPQLEEANS